VSVCYPLFWSSRYPALQRVEGREERMHGAVEGSRLSAQKIDPLGRRRGAAEHGRFYLLDVAVEALDHRTMVVNGRVD
jgi:hypothetical protein